jgi:hypothetical protein
VLAGRHSAKTPSPSPRRHGGGFSLPSTSWYSAKSLPSAREKILGKEGFADVLCVEPSLSSVFQVLPSGKAVDSGSVCGTSLFKLVHGGKETDAYMVQLH